MAPEAPVDFLVDVDEAEIIKLGARDAAHAAEQAEEDEAAEEPEAVDGVEAPEAARAAEEEGGEEDFAWRPHYLMIVVVRDGAGGAEYLLQDDSEGTWPLPRPD